jgi:hypothetical protein
MVRRFIPLLAVLVLAAAACHASAAATATSSDPFSVEPTASDSGAMPAATSVAPDASPTPPAVPASPPPKQGAPSATCAHGWVTPPADSTLYTDPLGIIRRTDPVKGEFVVVDMRMFHGPESPPNPEEGYLRDVTRWYIKLYDRSDLSYQGRFLVEEREFGRGLAAVAPYDTHGFRSPDWSGFQFTSENTKRRTYAGLPGALAGLRYNFVMGGEGLTFRGLPSAVQGCLDGT